MESWSEVVAKCLKGVDLAVEVVPFAMIEPEHQDTNDEVGTKHRL